MTYAELLTKARIETGKATLTDFDKEQLTYWLNEALMEAWIAVRYHLWPWAHEVAEVATDVDSRFDFTELNSNPWATVWTADPRLNQPAGRCIKWARRGDKVQVYGSGMASTTVWVTRATAVPQFDWETPGATDQVPEQFQKYLMAYISMRRWQDVLPADAEKLLDKAMGRVESARQDMQETASAEWKSCPWLDWWLCYGNES